MTPEISALLTTHNRAHLLPRVLEGLQKQTMPQSRFELVVIDDGSKDDTQQLLSSYVDKLPLRIFRQEASGLAAAKNLGVFAARAQIVVFLDDDDVLEPNALAAHLETHLRYPELSTAVLAHTKLAPEVARSPLMHHVTETGGQLFSYKWIETAKTLGYQEFWGGRSSCKRKFLLARGVFNPEFRFGCEDIEIGWRLRPHNLRVIYQPAASATMIRTLSFDDFCRRSYLQGRSQFRFSQIHTSPEIRDYCEIDHSIDAWQINWRRYAAILRIAQALDQEANQKMISGQPLKKDFQKKLNAAYFHAFALTRAKGVIDAQWAHRAKPPAPRNSNYGLEGNFENLMKNLNGSPHTLAA